MSKRVQVVHSEDATTVVINGDPRNPEPAAVVVLFPGGHVEVSRCSDGSYWTHFTRSLKADPTTGRAAGEIVDSRVDYRPGAYHGDVPPLPAHADIRHIAVRIAKAPGSAA